MGQNDMTASDNIAADTLAAHEAAGFGRALQPGTHPALLLIDFAAAYFTPDSPLYAGVESARAQAARLHSAARAAGIPVIFTRVEYSADGHEGGVFYRKIAALKCFETGNPLADFTPELLPLPGDELVTKHYPSAFFGTGLATTSGCVRASAVDALCHGFIPLVVTDAIGDRDAAIHAANLFDLRAKTAELVTTADMEAYFAVLKA
jgi:maleamate amidohydrolase